MAGRAIYKNCIVLFTLFVILAGSVVYGISQPISKSGEMVMVIIKAGMTSQEIAGVLHQAGLIDSPVYFLATVKLEGMDNSLKAGEYAFNKSMSVSQMIATLAKGESAQIRFTIPEGYTIAQIAQLLESKKLASAAKFKALAVSYAPFSYMETKNPVTYKAEGYIFPDTYQVTVGISEESLLTMMSAQFNRQLTPAMRQRAGEMNLSIREVVILASLVEREAKMANERPIVAAVFMNRLKLGMSLQSCATIQYILGYPKPELTIQDTETPSPYNTYQNSGLPPGPIANPGIAAITAVLYPATTDYLYFVADKNGTHHFSRTYEEHLAAINEVSN